MRRTRTTGDGAQLHTIEGIAAAIFLVLALTFSIDVIAVTSTTSTTSSEEIENQFERLSSDVLSASRSNGQLKAALLNWSSLRGRWAETDGRVYYQSRAPPGEFGRVLSQTFEQRNIAYNINLVFKRRDGTVSRRFVYNGAPSVNSVTAETVVVLYDDDEDANGVTLENSNYPIDDLDEPTGVYNIVEVRLTVWRR